MRVIICDDNDISRNMYNELFKGIAAAEGISAEFIMTESGEDLLEVLRTDFDAVDLIYLDIYLEGMDGLSVAREIRHSGYKGDIVICSSDDSRALEAYQINAVNYIVKGATDYYRFREVFLNSCRKAAASVHDSLTLTKDRKKIDIEISRISYFEVYNRMLITHYTENNRLCSLESYGSLKRIEELLSGKEFIRIHNSYLVNGKQIKLVFSDSLQLFSGEKLPVSRSHKNNLVEYWTSTRS